MLAGAARSCRVVLTLPSTCFFLGRWVMSCTTFMMANAAPRSAQLLTAQSCAAMALFQSCGTGECKTLSSWCQYCLFHLAALCRKQGAGPCSPQETLQQVVVQEDLSHELPVTSKLHVGGMCCPSEVPIVNSALGSLPGVIKVGTSHIMAV